MNNPPGATGLARIEYKIDKTREEILEMSKQVVSLNRSISELEDKLNALSGKFGIMINDQQKATAMQKAVSELIRVRQEIDQRYGKYTEIRETMIGILQATDAAIVKKSTISRVSEELMLSAPRYWLAPCLIAVAAWISNDRDLAGRAIEEALKRDAEKTALAMALICRRNGRIQTAHEWLALYFSKQSVYGFTDDSFTYVDAYVNGVFGPDETHMCQGYLEKWLREARGDTVDFEEKQARNWAEYCRSFEKPVDEYPVLEKNVTNFDKITPMIGRIKSTDEIRRKFQMINDAFVDVESLRQRIDQELVRLVGNYDVSEVGIRREEEYLELFKKYEGDEERAKAEMEKRERRRQQKRINLIEQMTREIRSDENVSSSKRKTALSFLSPYINKGYRQYMTEKREVFPDHIDLCLDEWRGTARGEGDYNRLVREYEQVLDEQKNREAEETGAGKERKCLALLVFFGVLSVALWFFQPFFAILSAIIFVFNLFSLISVRKNSSRNIERIDQKYQEKKESGEKEIRDTLIQWRQAKQVVEDFDESFDNWNIA